MNKKKKFTKSVVSAILPESRTQSFAEEENSLQDMIFLGDTIDLDKCPVHRFILSLLKKISVAEAAVERAFSRHRLVHTRLRANLEAESMDNQLFIRYNFETIMKWLKDKLSMRI